MSIQYNRTALSKVPAAAEKPRSREFGPTASDPQRPPGREGGQGASDPPGGSEAVAPNSRDPVFFAAAAGTLESNGPLAAHKHIHTYTHTHTYTPTHMQMQTSEQTAPKHVHTHTRTHARTHANTQTYTRKTNKNNHTHTQTLTNVQNKRLRLVGKTTNYGTTME